MKSFKRSIGIVLWVLVVAALAQSYESGGVVKWGTKAYASHCRASNRQPCRLYD